MSCVSRPAVMMPCAAKRSRQSSSRGKRGHRLLTGARPRPGVRPSAASSPAAPIPGPSPPVRATERARRARTHRDRSRRGDRTDRCRPAASPGGSADQSRASRATPRSQTWRSASCHATRFSTMACQATSTPKIPSRTVPRMRRSGVTPRAKAQPSTAAPGRNVASRSRAMIADRRASTSRSAMCRRAFCAYRASGALSAGRQHRGRTGSRISVSLLGTEPGTRRSAGAPRRSGTAKCPRERRRAGVPAARTPRGGVGWGIRRGEAPRSSHAACSTPTGLRAEMLRRQ